MGTEQYRRRDNLVQFRISEDVESALKARMQPGESIDLVAAKSLRCYFAAVSDVPTAGSKLPTLQLTDAQVRHLIAAIAIAEQDIVQSDEPNRVRLRVIRRIKAKLLTPSRA